MSANTVIYCLQISSGSVSFMSSSLIAMGIMKSGGFSSPSRRIIFGISVSDMIQSASIITGPFMVPSNVPSFIAPWAIGNYHSCRAQGFFFIFASGTTPMYFFGLCLFTTFKIKYNISDEKFSQRIEKVLHVSIIFLNLSICLFGIITRTINSSVVGSTCMFAAYPTGCRQIPSIVGECNKITENVIPILSKTHAIALPGLCLIGILCCMGTVCWEIMIGKEWNLWRTICPGSNRAATRSRGDFAVAEEVHSGSRPTGPDLIVTTNQPSPKNTNHEDGKEESGANLNMTQEAFVLERDIPIAAAGAADEGASANPQQETHQLVIGDQDPILSRNSVHYSRSPRRSEHFTRKYYREIVIQCFSFILAFLLTFIIYWHSQILLLWTKIIPSTLELRVVHVLYPLGGFFNVLAYSRPKIRALRIRNPGYSWFRAFLHVMRTGGDMHVPITMSFQGEAVGNRLHNVLAPVQESIAFGALNMPPETTNLSLSNVALDNCSASFSTDHIGHRNESSWTYVRGATNDDEIQSFDDGRITNSVTM